MKMQVRHGKEAEVMRQDNGLAFTLALAFVTVLMVLATAGLAALWQASAEASEPDGISVQADESSQVSAEIDGDSAEASDGSDKSKNAPDSDESATSESSDQGATSATDAPDEPAEPANIGNDNSPSADNGDSSKSAESSDASSSADSGTGANAGASAGGPGGISIDESKSSSAAGIAVTDAKDSSESADASEESAESSDAAEKPQNEKTRTLRQKIKLANGDQYTVTVVCDPAANVPKDAKLKVVHVMQTPEGYDPHKAKWRNRPTESERFLSAAKMKSRKAELNKVFDVKDDEHVFYTEFLDISFVVDGNEIQPAVPVEITVETDTVKANSSNAIAMSFFTQIPRGQKHGNPLAIENHSSDSAKKKAYKKGSKFTFTADKLSELGIEGIVTPVQYAKLGGLDIAIFVPRGSSVSSQQEDVDESTLPEGSQLIGAFSAKANPTHSYGDRVWIEVSGEYDEADAANDEAGAEAEEGTEEEIDAESEAAADAEADESAEASASSEQGSLECYLLEDGVLTEKLFDAESKDQFVSIDSGDAVALVWKTAPADADASDDEQADEGGEPAADDQAADDQATDEQAADEQAADDQAPADAADAADAAADAEPARSIAADSTVEAQAPAAILRGTLNANYGGTYAVKVSYGPKANIPDDATLSVRELSGAARQYVSKQALRAIGAARSNYLRAFDITILDAQGNKVEPAAPVEVTIQLLNAPIMTDPAVVHLAGADTDVIDPDVVRRKGTCTLDFASESFSVYVIVDENNNIVTPRLTYNFWLLEEGAPSDQFASYEMMSSDTQTVKGDEKPYVPQPTSNAERTFAGWYEGTVSGSTVTLNSQPYDFNNLTIPSTSERSTVDLFSKFTDYANVVFHDQYDPETRTFPIAFTRHAELQGSGSSKTATVQISDLTTTYNGGESDVEMAFYGWSRTPITEPNAENDDAGNPVQKIDTDTITVSGTTHLYPIFKPIHWLSFNSSYTGSGATYVPSARYFEGDGPTSLAVPEYEGHTFNGWYTGSLNTSTTPESVNFGVQISNADGSLKPNASDAGVKVEIVGGVHKLLLTNNVTLYANWQENATVGYKVTIWKQKASDAPDLDDSDKSYDFAECQQLTAPRNSTVSVPDDCKNKVTTDSANYAGFKDNPRCDASTTVNPSGSTVLNVYYDRETLPYTGGGTFKLQFVDSATGADASADLPTPEQDVAYNTVLSSYVPDDPASGRAGYSFAGWYADATCTTPVFFDKASYNASRGSKALYDTMPDHNLTIYAGWEKDWYLVQIDPNYGALYSYDASGKLVGTGSTWFWEDYGGDPIQEYTNATRDYIESSSGTYYYAKRDRAYYGYSGNEWDKSEPDRQTFYTENPDEGTEDTLFEYAPGAYRYAGWYEVHEDGSETPYNFNQQVTHDTTLKLHWKKVGSFYLAYDAGEGTLDTSDENEELYEELDNATYADNAVVVITRSATPADANYTFAGWRVRGDDSGVVYGTGQTFNLSSDFAIMRGGKETVYLDAVYTHVDRASITYDTNNGNTLGPVVDYGETPEQPVTDPTVKSVSVDGKSATIANLVNNSKVKLSSGMGFTKDGATLLGWSNRQTYDPNDSDAKFYKLSGTYGVDTAEPTTLFAVWGVPVTYHLNTDDTSATWGGTWDESIYTYNGSTNTYSQTAYLGTAVSQPNYTPQSGDPSTNRTFRYWSTEQDGSSKYNFSTPVAGSLDLYAHWDVVENVAVHVASRNAANESTNKDATWRTKETIEVDSDGVAITSGLASACAANVSADYDYVAAYTSDAGGLPTGDAIRQVYYNSAESAVYVKYADTTKADAPLGENGICFVYTQRASVANPTTVEVHVARVENGDLILDDEEYRTTDAGKYRFDIAYDQSAEFLTEVDPEELYDSYGSDGYAFGAVVYGSDNGDGTTVTLEGAGAASIESSKITGSDIYALKLKDASGNELAELGDNHVYYLYYPMPKIKYVKEKTDKSLVNVTGSTDGEHTAPGGQITYDRKPVKMNGVTVEQNQQLEIPVEGRLISQNDGLNGFRMPPILDDDINERYLSYTKVGTGPSNAASIDDINASTELTMRIRVQNNRLEYSFDDEQWEQMSEPPTIYAVYEERGYDLLITKAVNTRESGPNSIFTDSVFTVTVRSASITKDSYVVDGADATVTPTSGSNQGTITFDVVDGSKVKVQGLPRGSYTIAEMNNDRFDLSAKGGSISSSSPEPLPVTGNSSVSISLSGEMRVDLTNSPKKLCKVVDGTEHVFYTLSSAVAYVEANMATTPATIEMLVDYRMPAGDTPEIPNGLDITLTTATDGEYRYTGSGAAATITRTEALAGTPMFTNSGSFALSSVVLDGAGVQASQPVIQSEGDLAIGTGAIIRNARNSGNGGAINATAGSITIDRGRLTDNWAASGGAIYYSGNTSISLKRTAEITNNRATDGDGGAIYATSGSVSVSGSSRLADNKAENGRGGAIYADNAVIAVESNGTVTNSEAKSGGAIYAQAGTVTVAGNAQVTSNKATEGDGGAIYVGMGMVTVSGGEVSDNTAEAGRGGAIFADSADVTVSGGEVSHNEATDGGAIYATSGTVTVSGGEVSHNEATGSDDGGGTITGGDGGAIYAGSGAVAIEGTLTNNTAHLSGGAVFANTGSVTVSDGSLTNNTAGLNGGAIYAGEGVVVLSCDALSNNTATNGSGGAVYAVSGMVSVDGVNVGGNQAKGDGGAIYAGTGVLNATGSTFSGNTSTEGNGGALYANEGNVTVSGGSMAGNAANAGNGGAIYAGGSSLSVKNITINGNNSAMNGAAVYVVEGTGTFGTGTYITGNVASAGGAVGVNSDDARLVFTGNVRVTGNTLGTGGSATASNVYLDQDSDTVINADGLAKSGGKTPAIGVHVPDEPATVFNNRGVPGARFGSFSHENEVPYFTNDRTETLRSAVGPYNKLMWASPLAVEVYYVASFANGFPPVEGLDPIYTTNDYSPKAAENGASEIAADLFPNFKTQCPNAGYAVAFADSDPTYEHFVTEVNWNDETGAWDFLERTGSTAQNATKLIIYYADPVYITIENNTDFSMAVTDLTVLGHNAVDSSTNPGYGYVVAVNGKTQTKLLPITAENLTLAPWHSIRLLMPGAGGQSYSFTSKFTNATEDIPLRRTGANPETITAADANAGIDRSGTLVSQVGGTTSIVFGSEKPICKIVADEGITDSRPVGVVDSTEAGKKEYLFAKMRDAEGFREDLLPASEEVSIQMLVDYLMPGDDTVTVADGFNVTITTATTGNRLYDGDRATISRDASNLASFFSVGTASRHTDYGTVFTVRNLSFDGKALVGTGDGGAIWTYNTKTTVDDADFSNFTASNGGALYVQYSVTGANYDVTDTTRQVLTVSNSNFTNCISSSAVKRKGGGAIWANAKTFELSGNGSDKGVFESCKAVGIGANGEAQGGAVFYCADKTYTGGTYFHINGCIFSNCEGRAGGALECDAQNNVVENCKFQHCKSIQRNGGALNIYIWENGNTSNNCWATITNCEFEDCHVNKLNNAGNAYGGAVRSAAKETTMTGCTFKNTSAEISGGALAVWSTGATKLTISDCSFSDASAKSNGGAIYCTAREFTISKDTTISKATTTSGSGAGIYHASTKTSGSNKAFTHLTGLTASDCTTPNSGGAVWSNTYDLSLTNCTLRNNTATGTNAENSGNGGGVCYASTSDTARLTVTGGTFEGNVASGQAKGGGQGGGIYAPVPTVSIDGAEIKTCRAAKAGGGLFQDNFNGASTCTISNAKFSGCSSTSSNGGGMYVNTKSLALTNTEISNNTAALGGGGVMYSTYGNRLSTALTVTGGTISGNVASGENGGGICAYALTLDMSGATISNCTAAKAGGGLFHNNNGESSGNTRSRTSLTGCTVTRCTARGETGGGVHAASLDVSLTGNCALTSNTASGDGGGMYIGATGDTFTLNGGTVSGNTSGGKGGGICSNANTTFYNVLISGNKLSSATTGNAAGMWLSNDKTLTIGEVSTTDYDSSTIQGNFTQAMRPSNLRLPEKSATNAENDTKVIVNCSLNGKIYVVNANYQGTWFGTSPYSVPSTWRPDGFTDAAPVFESDEDSVDEPGRKKLRGIWNRLDETDQQIIWGGPPICKITDPSGNLLYFKINPSDTTLYEAVFDRLDNGNGPGNASNANADKTGAFAILKYKRSDLPLYNADGTPYSDEPNENEFHVKMLVPNYTVNNRISMNGVNQNVGTNAWMKIVFETETEKDPDKSDGFPYRGNAGTRCTITRGANCGTYSMIDARVCFTVQDIVLDGGYKEDGTGITTSAKGVFISNASSQYATIEVSENAQLQNGYTTTDGGAVYLEYGNFVLNGGTIRSCIAQGNGGGIDMNWRYRFPPAQSPERGFMYFYGGTVTQCSAKNGGGVYLGNWGKIEMSGGTISRCEAENGGGLFVDNASYTGQSGQAGSFSMSGGRIINNSATVKGGGIGLGNSDGARLFFSGRPYVTGNSLNGEACNLQLDGDSNAIINTNNGGLDNGATIGVYVPGASSEGEALNTLYDKHGKERRPFGTFKAGDDMTTFYGFVNDRNGLKGGLISDGSDMLIYWVKIYSLQVGKDLELSANAVTDTPDEAQAAQDEVFEFRITLTGEATVPGQKDAKDIEGWYGGMLFTSDTVMSTSATVRLKASDEPITAENISYGLSYRVEEIMTDEQKEKYAAVPSTVRTGIIGENKDDPDERERYISRVRITNILPVCKITDTEGNLLYYHYDDEHNTPAVFTELADAFEKLESNGQDNVICTGSDLTSPKYANTNGNHVEMLVDNYTMPVGLSVKGSEDMDITLTRATDFADDYPYRGTSANGRATLRRGYNGASLFTVENEGKLKLQAIALNGMKGIGRTASTDGGLVHVQTGGSLDVDFVSKKSLTGNDEDEGNVAVALSDSKTSLRGGAVYVALGGTLDMQGGSANFNKSTASGGALYVAGSASISGTEVNSNVSGTDEIGADGAGIYLAILGTLNLSDVTMNYNESTANGGALYVAMGARASITGGASGVATDENPGSTINHNVCGANSDGAGIYLAEIARLELSGILDFGGVNSDVGNIKDFNLPDKSKNGGKVYSKPRQDIFIAGYERPDEDADEADYRATSLVIADYIDVEAGSIWVWAAEDPHYKTLQQFAQVATDFDLTESAEDSDEIARLKRATLEALRDARTDADSENSTGTFLHGMMKSGDSLNIYWSGIEGSRKVMLRKVKEADGATAVLEGAKFSISKTENGDPITIKDDEDNDFVLNNTNLVSDGDGVFFVGKLDYGTYYIRESSPNTKTFEFVISDGEDDIVDDVQDGFEIALL